MIINIFLFTFRKHGPTFIVHLPSGKSYWEEVLYPPKALQPVTTFNPEYHTLLTENRLCHKTA